MRRLKLTAHKLVIHLQQPVSKVFYLSEGFIGIAVAHTLSVLRDLNDLVSLKGALADLHLETGFQGFQMLGWRLFLQLLFNGIDLLLYLLEPIVEDLLDFPAIPETQGSTPVDSRGSNLGASRGIVSRCDIILLDLGKLLIEVPLQGCRL